jgi:16S rRNA (guanine1207-N2)-methyltransferase
MRERHAAAAGPVPAPGRHYFSPAQEGPLRPRTIRFHDGRRAYEFRTAAGVFSRRAVDRGTRLLLDTVTPEKETDILDLGCGYGAVGIVMAARAPRASVVLVDVNPRAAALAQENIRLNGVANAEVWVGDGCAPLGGRQFDLILLNPPIRAGREVVLRLLRDARACLRPGGRLYFVARTSQGARTLGRLMAGFFDPVTEVERGGGFRVYEGRAADGRAGEDGRVGESGRAGGASHV